MHVDASSPPLSVAKLRLSQPPHRTPRSNPLLRAGASSAVPIRPQWKRDVGHVGGDVTDADVIGKWW